jgi:cation transport protein ChaC
LTHELVAGVDRREADPGPEAGYIELSNEDYLQAAQSIALENAKRPLWLFAYGSLIWKPNFEHVEHRSAKAFGWRRSFCLQIARWRATPQQPGLMMCLDRGGCCEGIAFRLPASNSHSQLIQLLRRETSYKGDLDSIRWIAVRAGGEKLPP